VTDPEQAADLITPAYASGVDRLPMAPSCGLDERRLRLQFARYRTAGAGAHVVQRSRLRLVVDLDDKVDLKLVDELLATERECCPFFELGWTPEARRLSVSVSQNEHEPALDAIAVALNLPARQQSRGSGRTRGAAAS
jgi:hypothetical protein